MIFYTLENNPDEAPQGKTNNWKPEKPDRKGKATTGGGDGKPPMPNAIAAGKPPRSAGGAGAVFPCAKPAWMKMSGGCPAMVLPGSALTAEVRTVSEISDQVF